MATFSSNTTMSDLRVLPATLALLICCMIGFLSVNLGGQTLTLTWLPLLAVALWPRGILPTYTICVFLVVGVFVDWGSAGAPGQWALIYLASFAVLRPDRRIEPFNFISSIKNWVIAVIVALVLFTVTGRFVYGVFPDFTVMTRQAGIITLLMPIFYMLRYGLRYVMTDPDDRAY